MLLISLLFGCLPHLLSATPASDSLRVMALSDKVWTFLPNEPSKGLPIAYEALALARTSGNEWLIASGYNDIASCYIFIGANDSALLYLDSCLILRERLNDAHGQAAVHNKKGAVFTRQGLWEEAIYETELSLSYFQRMRDTVNIGNLLNNLAVLHIDLRDYRKSIFIGHEVLKYRQAMRDTLGIAKTYINLSNGYGGIGDTVRSMWLLDSALAVLAHSDNQADLAIIYNNKGVTYLDWKQYALAEANLLRALEIAEKGNYKGEALSTLGVLGELYQKTGDFARSLEILRSARELSIEIGSKRDLRFIYKHLAALFEDMGRLDSAYYYLKERQRLTEEIFDENSAEALHRTEVKYAVLKKENENLLLKKDLKLSAAELQVQTSQAIALGAALLVVALLSLVIFLRLRNRQKARVLALQQANIAALIQGEQQERGRVARELHDGLGQLLSTARINVAALEGEVAVDEQSFVTNAMTLIDRAVVEVRNVSHNLMPDALIRHGLKAGLEGMAADVNRAGGPQMRLDMPQPPSSLNADESFALFRLIQELVTNAIRHAAASEIWIIGRPGPEGYTLEVGDNGKGFDVHRTAESAKGIGTQNIQARLGFLDARMEVESQVGAGSRFILHLPKL